jgi:lactoylglutathione lyase
MQNLKPLFAMNPSNPRFQQTMLRIKDPKVSVPFYVENFGMKLVHWIEFPQWKFTVYFLETQPEGHTSPECTLEKATVESEHYLNNMRGATIELTHNHGSENDDECKMWNGNTGKDADGANYVSEYPTPNHSQQH